MIDELFLLQNSGSYGCRNGLVHSTNIMFNHIFGYYKESIVVTGLDDRNSLFVLYKFPGQYISVEYKHDYTNYNYTRIIKECSTLFFISDFDGLYSSYYDYVSRQCGGMLIKNELIDRLSMVSTNTGPWAYDHGKALFRPAKDSCLSIEISEEDNNVVIINDSKKKYKLTVSLAGAENTSGYSRRLFLSKQIKKGKFESLK